MRILLVTFSFLFINCSSNKNASVTNITPTSSSEYFQLIDAKSEKWTSGVNGGGFGTEYYFKIKINTSKDLLFPKVWIMNKDLDVFISNTKAVITNNPIVFQKGDTITLRASDLSSNKKNETEPPIKFEGEALITYQINNTIEYFIVTKINKTATPNRP